MTREQLIGALEKATGPSNVLDGHSFMLAAPEFGKKPWRRTGQRFWDDSDPNGLHYVDAPRYTSSIDAALTLVPEGWRWSLDWTQRPHYQDCGRADLYAPGGGIKPPDVPNVYGSTPAIAICIAALKARTS